MSTESMPDPLAKRFGYALKRAQNALRAAIDDALRPLALTAPQYAVLAAIELDPGLSNAALARAAFVTPQTMHGIVANLERAGMLRRKSDPTHARILQTELTRRGATTLRRAHACVAAVEARMLGALAPVAVESLTQTLLACADALGVDDAERG